MHPDPQTYLSQQVAKSGKSFKQWYGKVYLRSDHWKQLRKQKFREAGKICCKCGHKRSLQVHHLNYHHIFDVQTSDLEVLCHLCHREVHAEGNPKVLRKIALLREKRDQRMAENKAKPKRVRRRKRK